MSNWREATIGQLVAEGVIEAPTDGNHGEIHPKGSDFVDSGIPFVMASDIENGVVNLATCKFISESQATKLRKGFSVEGDVLLTHKATIGRTSVVPKIDTPYIMLTPQVTYYRVKDKDKLDNRFLKYYFDYKPFQETLALWSGAGSTRAYLGITGQHNLTVRLPKINVQTHIADVLAALDAKIDCNNRLNAELEAMVKTLYDYWFVQFDFPDTKGRPYRSSGGKMVYNLTLKREIPEGWEDSNVLAVADLFGGGTPTKKKAEYWGGNIPFFTPTDANGTIFKFSTSDYITEEGLNGSSTRLFGKNTVFITARGSVGKLVLAGVDMAMNQSCYALRAKPGISHTYLFFLTKELIHHLQVKSSGSVFDSIVSNDIEFTKLAIPDSNAIQRFAAVAEPAFERIANNTKENQQLIQLRDWLLPMLMNGQIVVV
ncbi:restriction endonuclease subunit S [Burkholderia cepacia]|uniref:restriction endonuclease subunit S n=1 Tax=Burkholderia cepacia complex TaxID=87882 RepID=UPI00075F1E1F|nr:MULTISPECIES: restriction endonuclease subunit S [Burkholderia cepacia complex]KVF66292.1 restriction endonuclease subunit S [Burkholderia cepacia]MCA7919514.1 restriction endonuclease subunit S [Burkholderia contaminans]MCA7995913.1 restriction endonuclease subunit S [Burkholderia cepacia]UUX37259.1 restriction endonuclease subunit S [Burkholderia contaminans]